MLKIVSFKNLAVAVALVVVSHSTLATTVRAESVNITFPVIGPATYSDDFLGDRFNGKHYATDIFAKKGQKIVSAVDGVIRWVPYPIPNYGWSVFIDGNDGYQYYYLHMNNDNPGTDDGRGGAMLAYAPDVQNGNLVKRGQHIGYVGDSGNAENTPPHLHFEIYQGDRPLNPYPSLKHAQNDGRVLKTPVSHPPLNEEILPYGEQAYVGANISYGNFITGDGQIVSGAAKGGGPHVRVFNSRIRESSFFAYNKEFRGGVDVTAGDIDGDGIDEIITAPGPGGGPHIKVFSYNGTEISSFFAYDKTNRSGVRVTAADIDGDGTDEIITGPRAGGGPHIRAFSVAGEEKLSFFSHGKDFRGGVDVDAGYINDDNKAEIVVGPGPGGGPDVRIFSETGVQLNSFWAYDKANRSGVRVAVGDTRLNYGTDEIVTMPASSGGPNVRVYSGIAKLIGNYMAYEEWWRGGYDVTTTPGQVTTSAGDSSRRATIRGLVGSP